MDSQEHCTVVIPFIASHTSKSLSSQFGEGQGDLALSGSTVQCISDDMSAPERELYATNSFHIHVLNSDVL